MDNLFVIATRSKFRFAATGNISTEDLWDLPLTGRGANLDDIARGLDKDIKAAEGEVSFVKPPVKKTADLHTKLEVVKFIIAVKMSERDTRMAEEEKATKKQKIMAILEKKKDADLEGKSAEELQALLNTM